MIDTNTPATVDEARAVLQVEYGSLLEGFSEPAAVIDDHFRIVASNEEYRQRFADGASVDGRHCHEVSHHLTARCPESGELCPIDQCRATGKLSRVLHVHYTPTGAEHEEVTIQPLPGPNGQVTAFLERIHVTSVASVTPRPGSLVGRSAAFTRMLDALTHVAQSTATVLLLGESGSGKEMVARALHQLSPRAARPFVPVDCSGFSEQLFESELFGHEKGAFTSAYAAKRGLIEAAQGGTVLLDEVGDIPLPQQVKLLRLIETRVFRRVGSVTPQTVDFRLVCATHRNLKQMVYDGSFRQDLYYRISAFPVQVPPLRDRRDDIPLLIESYLQSTPERRRIRVSDKALALLRRYEFPGNVRELHNMLERACLLADGQVILPEHLPREVRMGWQPSESRPADTDLMTLDEVQNRYLSWALAHATVSRPELARRLGVSQRTLYRRIRRLQAPARRAPRRRRQS